MSFGDLEKGGFSTWLLCIAQWSVSSWYRVFFIFMVAKGKDM